MGRGKNEVSRDLKAGTRSRSRSRSRLLPAGWFRDGHDEDVGVRDGSLEPREVSGDLVGAVHQVPAVV